MLISESVAAFLKTVPINFARDLTDRYGVEVEGRHTAIGDALAAASVLLRMLDKLQARGIDSLYKAHAISKNMIEIRKMQERF